MKNKPIKLLFAILTISIFLQSGLVLAATGTGGATGGGTTEFGQASNIGEWVSSVLNWAMRIIGLLGVLVIIYAGFIYMTSQGMPDRIKLAHQLIMDAIIGILLLFLVGVLMNFIVPK